jgi:hypothetical protein
VKEDYLGNKERSPGGFGFQEEKKPGKIKLIGVWIGWQSFCGISRRKKTKVFGVKKVNTIVCSRLHN